MAGSAGHMKQRQTVRPVVHVVSNRVNAAMIACTVLAWAENSNVAYSRNVSVAYRAVNGPAAHRTNASA
jgi:hypothetical protein